MSSKLHILEVTKSTGGVAAYVRGLIQGLDPHQFRFTVACLSEGSASFAAELNRMPGVQAFSIAMNRYNVDPLGDSRAGLQLARRIRQEPFDLIHAHASKPGFLVRLAAARSGVPVIYSPHCFAFHAGAGRRKVRIIAGLESLAARYLTTRIITVCEEERTWALQHGVGNPDQVIAIPTGMDLQVFDQPVDRAMQRTALGVPADVPLVGTVGRLSDQKAPLDFVRAAALVHQQRPDAHFVWIGSGPLEERARALVDALGLSRVWHFAGQREDVPQLLPALDCFVLSSHWEGFSLSVLEAMAARLPVVATRVMGIAETVQAGVNGLTVRPGDTAALGAAVLELLNDPQRARRMGNCGRQRMEQQFTRNQMLARIARVYQEMACQASHTTRYRRQLTA